MESIQNATTPAHVPGSKQLLSSIFNGDEKAKLELEPVKEDYCVRLENFEGPLDLLLHLIRREQIELDDIPISTICQSYLEYLELMKQFDVNIAGEFMVMAATLTFLKSQLLIPKDEEEEVEEEDPRLPLVQQLLEYKRYKEAAETINEWHWMGRDIYPRSSTAIQKLVPKEAHIDAPIAPVDSFKLLVCLKSAIDRTERPPMEIRHNTINLKEKVGQMTVALTNAERVEFSKLALPSTDKMERKRQIVMTFLAILELAKLKYIRILQHENFGPIQIIQVRPLSELDTGLLDAY